jgi:hypothetical protein
VRRALPEIEAAGGRWIDVGSGRPGPGSAVPLGRSGGGRM